MFRPSACPKLLDICNNVQDATQMSEKSYGRIFQDDSFIFKAFDNLKIEKVSVVQNPETKSICLVFLKVENHNWHRLFLDVGFAVWENWNEETIEEDDSYDYIDKTIEFEVFNKTIVKIYCEPLQHNCQVVIELENEEKLILRAKNQTEIDGETELIKLEQHQFTKTD